MAYSTCLADDNTVLLRVHFGMILPFFIEIGSQLTDKKQKISLQSFLRHGVYDSY